MPISTPSNVSTGPGLLYAAPLATADPTDATTTLDAAFVMIGYTDDGSTFDSQTTSEPIEVAEEVDPIAYYATSRESNFSFSMAETTAENLALALNSGVLTTTPTEVEAPDIDAEVRIKLVLEASTGARWLFRKCYQSGQITLANQKAPQKRLIPVTFRLELPDTGKPWTVFPSSTGLV